ncbi:MAG: hypothetical protein JWP10_891 [Nocardioidaceae bacterium]|nr:hypothetical protein [Nocardioidaceae bacterium]
MQREIVALERRIATLEDEELEVMEALDEAQTALASVVAELDAVAASLEETQAAYDKSVGVIDAQVSNETRERAFLVPSIPVDLLALYEKLRAQYSVGAGALRQRRCEACRLELNGADLREIATKPADEVIRCPECDRILIRTNESGI